MIACISEESLLYLSPWEMVPDVIAPGDNVGSRLSCMVLSLALFLDTVSCSVTQVAVRQAWACNGSDCKEVGRETRTCTVQPQARQSRVSPLCVSRFCMAVPVCPEGERAGVGSVPKSRRKGDTGLWILKFPNTCQCIHLAVTLARRLRSIYFRQVKHDLICVLCFSSWS